MNPFDLTIHKSCTCLSQLKCFLLEIIHFCYSAFRANGISIPSVSEKHRAFGGL